MKMVTGCLRKIEKINICIKLAKMCFLVTSENMGLCLYILKKVISYLRRACDLVKNEGPLFNGGNERLTSKNDLSQLNHNFRVFRHRNKYT